MRFPSLFFSGVALLALLGSCSQDQPATSSPAQAPATPESGAPAATASATAATTVLTSADVVQATGHDTLRTAAGQVITVQPIDLATWRQTRPENLPAPPDSADAASITHTGGRVQRDGLNLTFKAANGRTVVLRNDTTDGEDFTAYLYWGELPTVHQWVVNVGLYEGRYVVLIDQRTGQRTDVWGQPVASPDARYILAGSYDLAAAFDANGLQLLQLGPQGPKLIWQRELTNWGPAEARWRPDGRILVQQGFGPTEAGGDLPPRYVALQLPATIH